MCVKNKTRSNKPGYKYLAHFLICTVQWQIYCMCSRAATHYTGSPGEEAPIVPNPWGQDKGITWPHPIHDEDNNTMLPLPNSWGQDKGMAETIFEKVGLSICRLWVCRKFFRLSICRLSKIRPPFVVQCFRVLRNGRSRDFKLETEPKCVGRLRIRN